jgi:hypothetical protein
VHDHTSYVLTRGSRPEAAIIPYEEYLEYLKSREEEIHARFDAMLKRMEQVNAHFADEEVERDVEEVSRIVRARRARAQRRADMARSHKTRK